MTVQTRPEPGQTWVRLHTTYEVLDVTDGIVSMEDRKYQQTVEETIERFTAEVEAGRAVYHPACSNCGLPVDPEDGKTGPLHYECWFEQADVTDRCEAEVERPGANRLAAEALRADNPKEHLLTVIGDPVRTLHDRIDAEHLLSGAISTRELLDAQVRCPVCGEGEVFEIDPPTGAVHCHCGELLKGPD